MRHTVTLVALAAVLSSGCGFFRGMGRPDSSLAGRGINKLEIILPEGKRLCPGFSAQLKIRATSREGDVYVTQGRSGGTKSWANYDLSMRGGVVTPHGEMRLTGNPRLSWKRVTTVQANLVHNPRVSGRLVVPLSYDCAYKAHFRDLRPVDEVQGLNVHGMMDIVGVGDAGPVARLMLMADGTDRGGLFYLTAGATVEIDVRGAEPRERAGEVPARMAGDGGAVTLRIDPEASRFKSVFRVLNTGGKGAKDGPPLKIEIGEVYIP